MAIQHPSTQAIAKTLAILRSTETPDDAQLDEALKSPALKSGLDRWQLWTLICLCRHVLRQNWVGYIVETRLKTDLTLLGRAGAMGHPDGVPQSGEVPDEPGWRYYFHGCGCCITRESDGTNIDVDFTDQGGSDRIDRFFYSRFLEDLRSPEFPERLLRRTEPFQHAWQAEIEPLAMAGCIDATRGIRITNEGKELTDLLAPVVEMMVDLSEAQTSSARRRFLLGALSLGDVLLAQEIATSTEVPTSLTATISETVEGEKKRRSERLAHTLSVSSNTPGSSILTALGDLGIHYSKHTIIESTFRTPVDGIANQALAILVSWNDVNLSESLELLFELRYRQAFGWASIAKRLLRGQSASDVRIREYQVVHAATALFQRSSPRDINPKLRRKIIALLESSSGANSGEAALLLYVLDQGRGFGRLSSALSGRVPAAHSDAAAACVLIGTPEAKRILADALGNQSLQIQHTAACALKRFPSSDARELAAEWWARLDGIDSPQGKEVTIAGKTITAFPMDEVMHANMEMFFESSLERLRKKFGLIMARASY